MLQRSLGERYLSDGLEYQQLRAVLAKGADRAPPPCLMRRCHVCVDCGLPAVGLHTASHNHCDGGLRRRVTRQ